MSALAEQQSLSSQGSASLTPTATSSSYASSSKPSEFNDDASSISTVSEESEESKEPEPYQLPHDRAVATMNEEDDEDSYSSESSGESIVPDLGGDEDDDPSAKATGAGLLGYLGLGGQATKATEDDYAYDFEGEPQEPVDDEHYDFGDDEEPELDEDELLAEEGLKDDRLEARLALAYDVATAGVSSGREHPMKAPEFRKAVAVMGRVFSKEETDRFFDEALAFSEDRSALGVSSERDERGLLKRNVVEANPRRHALCLPKDDFVAYFSKFVTRTVDPREAAEHFRALVEGAAEQALRDPDTEASDELRAMADTKHRRVDELFIYARDLRKVVASMSERLTDEEADAFIRECKPEPLVGASDGGLERVYFHQYLNMLKDDS